MNTMLLHQLGELLELTEISKPECGKDEVILKVLTSSLNFADTLLINGTYQEKIKVPFAPGMEICGVIDSIGADVSTFEIGDRVVSYIGYGGLSEFVRVRHNQCLLVPKNISDEEAASLMIAYGSSELALNYKANLKQNETLLVLGAGGSVGLSAVEIGKIMGARVIAVARGREKCSLAKAKGADQVIDSEIQDIITEVNRSRGVDVIYDPVGGTDFRAILSLANPEARFLPIGFASGEIPKIPANIIMVKNVSVIGFYLGAYQNFKPHILTNCFTRLIDLCSKNIIKPNISHVFSLDRANQALDVIRNRKASGKVVIRVSEH